jgi:type I restriction enzyme S subunit
MQAYNMKDSGVEVLADIPTHWEAGKIKNGFYLKPSNVDKKTHDDEIAVELCNYVDVYYNDFIVNKLPFMEATAKQTEIDKFSLQIDDVIITKDSEDPMDIGVPALVKENKPNLVCGYHLTMLKKRLNNVSGAFLFWVLKDSAIASQLYREATGVTRWAISSRNIKNVSIPYPSYDEQKTIASYLDKACEKIDKALFIKQQQLDKLEAYRKSIIHEAVTKGLDENVAMKDSAVEWVGDIPEHWEAGKIKNGFYLKPSNVDKKTHDDEIAVELCNYVDVYYNDFIVNKLPFMEATAKQTEIDKFSLQIDDVIITKDSEDPMDIGVPALVKENKPNLVCGYHLTMLKKRLNNVSGAFLFWVLKDSAIASQLYREATGVTRWAISSRNIKNVSIPYPSYDEQKTIASYLDKACEKIDKTKAVIESQITTLSQYRQSLIHESVTGKKRIYQDDIN